jgi:hypothetical protein
MVNILFATDSEPTLSELTKRRPSSTTVIIVSCRDWSKGLSGQPLIRYTQTGLTYNPRYKTYAYENLKKSQPFAKGSPMKQAVIAPSMLYLLYPLNGTVEGYSKEQFVEDLVNEVEIYTRLVDG